MISQSVLSSVMVFCLLVFGVSGVTPLGVLGGVYVFSLLLIRLVLVLVLLGSYSTFSVFRYMHLTLPILVLLMDGWCLLWCIQGGWSCQGRCHSCTLGWSLLLVLSLMVTSSQISCGVCSVLMSVGTLCYSAMDTIHSSYSPVCVHGVVYSIAIDSWYSVDS